MSRLRHACAACNHEAVMHSSQSFYSACSCCKSPANKDRPGTTFDPSAEPTVIDTFDLRTFKPEDHFYGPGEAYNAGKTHKQVMCSCDACVALAEQVAS